MTWVRPALVVTLKGALASRSSMISGGNSRSASAPPHTCASLLSDQ